MVTENSSEIATDDHDYFEWIQARVALVAELWQEAREDQNQRFLDGDVLTNYEAKYQSSGRTLYYLELKKP